MNELVRIAAAGDIHCAPERRFGLEESFARLDGKVDLVLLAGDLTTCGEPEEAAAAAASERASAPVLAVLGNHDWHANRRDEVVGVLEAAGITVLERGWTVLRRKRHAGWRRRHEGVHRRLSGL